MSALEEYLVFVHLIEARGLHSLNDDGTAQPICVVEVGPTIHRHQKTDVKKDSLNCVWEKHMSFDGMMLTEEQFQHEKLAFKIYDKSHFTRNQVIGCYEIALNFIYRCKNREVYRTWVPLTRPESPVKEWGYLLFSAYVVKKGDPVPVHDEGDQKAIIEDNLLVPDLQRKGYLLNTYFYRAQDIPIVDSACSTFVNVRFNGMTAQSGIVYNTNSPKYLTRIQMPFYAPLRSDPIEVQLWQHHFGRPDSFIGGTQFSASSVMLKSMGPMWVNLYSTPSSTMHGVLTSNRRPTDWKEGDDLLCDYVGRLMVRLVVVPTERNPQLKVNPAEPLVTEPPQSDYRLRLSLFSATEIPVLGGYLQVVMRFGPKERQSPWVLGKEGKFHWMKQLRPITVLVPDDVDTMSDVIILVRHRVGSVIETISYMRIPPKKLLLGIKGVGKTSKNFVINGDCKPIIDDYNKIKPYAPVWRPLRHTDPDEDQKQLIAGFLLFSLGFGLERAEPRELHRGAIDEDDDKKEMSEEEEAQKMAIAEKEGKLSTFMDPPEFYSRSPCRVVVKVHQAVELPAGRADGLANPFIAVRFGGKAAVSKTVYNSTCPVFDQALVFDSSYDKDVPTPLFINVYHQDTFSRTFLARTEIDVRDIVRNPSACVPQRLYLTGGSSDKSKSKSFLLASVMMFDNITTPPPELVLKDIETFYFRIQMIGLRQLAPYGYGNVKKPSIRMSCPTFDDKVTEGVIKDEVQPRDTVGTAVDYAGKSTPPLELKNVRLPIAYLSAFYVTLQLFDQAMLGENCIGVCHVPVRTFIDSFLAQNPKLASDPTYVKIAELNSESKTDEDGDDEKKVEEEKDAETLAQEGLNGPPAEDVTPSSASSSSSSSSQTPTHAPTGEKLDEDDLPLFQVQVVDPAVNIVIDANDTNVVPVAVPEAELKKPGKIVLKAAVDASKDTKFTKEMEEELKKNEYSELKFLRGKQAGFSMLDKLLTNGGDDLTRQTEAGVLKCFLNGCLQVHQKRISAKKMPDIFKKDYVTRVFVYRAYNLVPLDKWIGKMLNPYLVVRNGGGEFVHLVSTRENRDREDPFNPGFFDCYELDTRFPINNELEIMVWSKSPFGDELIGQTSIDLERRMLNEEWFGWNRQHNVPRELRDLHNISSNVAQGKIEVRIEVVERAWAKTHPAESIAPPPPAEYEMRLVVWNTEGVKLGDVKKRGETVNQTMHITTMFNGEHEDKRSTDISWTTDGDTDWNWRFKIPVRLPCKVPRIKFTMWDAALVGEDVLIGEATYNLAKVFKEINDTRKPKAMLPRESVKFVHSNYFGEKIGVVNFEATIVNKSDADNDPVGEKQDEPNQNPYLPAPKRNPPPYAVLSGALAGFAELLKKLKYLILLVIILAVGIPTGFFQWLFNFIKGLIQ